MKSFPLLAFMGIVSFATSSAVAEQSKPNVVFLLADDLGWTGLGCFGSDLYETPNLDRLCETSVKFTNAYAACTVCSPTRASVMTGMYPARLRLTDFIAGQNRPYAKMRIPNWTKQIEPKHVTIAEALQRAGYRTGHVGKWHLESRRPGSSGATSPSSQGFDFTVSRPAGTRGYFLGKTSQTESGSGFLTDWLTDKACTFIRDSTDQPFFLYFAYNVPHTPIQGRADLIEHFRKKVKPGMTHDNPTYAAMVASLDQSVGRILQTLKATGLNENTMVVFTSDNGGLTQRYGKRDRFTENLPLRRGKGSAYEGGVRVPTIVHWPGVTKPAVCEQPIMTIDYYPTILEATGVAGEQNHNASMDGKSLVGLLKNPDAKLKRDLFWHYPHYHAGGDGPYSAIRSGKHRLIQFHEDMSVRLFDLENDLGEQNNLAQTNPDTAKILLEKLVAWRQSVKAQMPTANPNHDPKRATQVAGKQKRTAKPSKK